MSEKSDNTLILEVKVSVYLVTGLTGLHIGAIGLLLYIPIPMILRLGLVGLVGVSLAWSLWRVAGLGGRQRLRRLRIDAGENVALGLGEGDERVWMDCRPVECFVHPWLMILRLRCDGRRRPVRVVLGRDALAPPDSRRLRARLHRLAPGRMPAQDA